MHPCPSLSFSFSLSVLTMRTRSCSTSSPIIPQLRRVGLNMKRIKKKKLKLRLIKKPHEQARTLRKLKQLQRAIPGCHEMNHLGDLFEKTANYIFLLEAKLNLLRKLSTICGFWFLRRKDMARYGVIFKNYFKWIFKNRLIDDFLESSNKWFLDNKIIRKWIYILFSNTV